MTDPKALVARIDWWSEEPLSPALARLLADCRAALVAAVEDAARLEYVLPALSLADGDGDAIATRIGGALLLGMTGRAAIDAARKEKP